MRSCLNRMTTAEAPAAQVKEKDHKRYFRVDDDGKANMTAPAEAATWFKLISVPLENDAAHPGAFGDEIGVVTSWQLPGVFAGLRPTRWQRFKPKSTAATGDTTHVQATGPAKLSAPLSTSTYLTNPKKRRAKGLLQAWIEAKALKVLQKPSPTTRGRDRDVVVVGNRVEGPEQDDLDC